MQTQYFTPSAHPRRRKRRWSYLFMVLPPMALVLFFSYVPLAGWALSLFEYHPGTPLFQNEFIGFKYFEMFFNDRDIASSLANTLIFSLLNFALLPLPMLFAILLNEIESKRFCKLSQTITTLPHFISWVIVYSLAFSLFSAGGVVNRVLTSAGMEKQKLLSDEGAVYAFQTILSQWKSLGWSAIIYIAAIAGIDQSLYEAAVVDGAGRFRSAVYITIPGLMPTFVVLMLLSVSNFVNVGYEQYYVFRNAFVADKLEVLDLYTYRMGLQLGDYSYATSVGIIKSFISIALLLGANSLAKRVRGDGIL